MQKLVKYFNLKILHDLQNSEIYMAFAVAKLRLGKKLLVYYCLNRIRECHDKKNDDIKVNTKRVARF